MALDARYGALVGPGRLRKWEADRRPTSRATLAEDGGARLRRIEDEAARRSSLAGIALQDLVVLWVVDRAGRFVYGFEDVLDDGDGVRLFARPAALRLTPGLAKIGHPALVRGEAARIGGELRLEMQDGRPVWMVTNRSGRFGLNVGRTEAQLRNVRQDLEMVGLTVQHVFI